ncbi:hypothetical protein AAFF27_16605 [Xylophilus sp. GW821-FHT01B05]
MSADAYRVLHDAGLHARAVAGRLIVGPTEQLDDALREFIRFHKPGLLRVLAEAEQATADLLAAAMRACDHYGDSPAAREQMRAECLATPPHLQLDLLGHLRETYPVATHPKNTP